MSVQQKAGVVLPAACAVAASFDPALARSVGAAQGQAEVDPNIKRSPLCGRNFAMFSEDPHLTAVLAAAVVGGAQNAVVGPLLCCSQVTDAPDRRVDERTLQEIYLPPAAASLQAGPQGVRYGSGTLNGVPLAEAAAALLPQPAAKTNDTPSTAPTHALAVQLAAQCGVLVQNLGALPLKAGQRVAYIGAFAETPRYQGAGSSAVNSIKVDSLLGCWAESGLEQVGFAAGFDRQGKPDAAKQAEAVALAQKADVVLLCMGLDEIKESEGLDRSDMCVASNQIELLRALQKVNPNIVVVLSAGASVETPWANHCKALVYGALGGQAGAGAMLDVLTGKVNPSGKLAESWAKAYSDTPARDNFAGDGRTVQYREGLYVGYRYHQTAGVAPAYPFGFGLSYTTFAYADVKATPQGVSLTVTNTGDREGAEIVQVYVAKPDAKIFRPAQELKGFAKVQLAAGESKRVTVALDDKAFRYWNTMTNAWEVEGGSYEVRVGASCEDIRLTAVVTVAGTGAPNPYEGKSLPHYTSGKVQNVPDPGRHRKNRPQHDPGRAEPQPQPAVLAGLGCAHDDAERQLQARQAEPERDVPVQHAAARAGQDDKRCHQHGHGGRHRAGGKGFLGHRSAEGHRRGR